MKTFVHVEYDPNTAEVVCKFTDAFNKLPKDEQLDIAREVAQRMSDLVSSLEAIIARSPSSGS